MTDSPRMASPCTPLFDTTVAHTDPDKTTRVPALKEGVPRFLFIAPLQRISRDHGPDKFDIELYELPDDALSTYSIQQEFVSRDEFNSPFTRLSKFHNILGGAATETLLDVDSIEKRGYYARDLRKNKVGPGFHFHIVGGEIYEHMGMRIVALIAEVSRISDGSNDRLAEFNQIFYHNETEKASSRVLIEQFEQATTYFVKHVSREYFFGHRRYYVRWVGRTVVYGDKTAPPGVWFQGVPDQSLVQLAEGTYAQAGWGNNVAWTSNPDFQFIDLRRSAVMAQYVWCYLNDIDTRSVEILSRARRADHKRRIDFDKSLSDLIDLNYDLATASMFYERLGTESSVANRELVESILEAWGFRPAFELTSARLERLESILQARTEMRSRRTSSLMEWILFALSVTGLLSLILGIIGTAYSGESGGDEPWFPSSGFLSWFRAHIDWWIGATIVVSLVLLWWVYRYRKAPSSPREITHVTVRAAQFDDD
ncbi:hypothetical protein [Corynebacterium cystitidis]|uniref:hypothetical protein n=1 Tax=Corynebacterium cystitidis TaxID=35757 RepID=UPI00211E92ED|nr:hypothetical protein [Corynebacterium cystitidis]